MPILYVLSGPDIGRTFDVADGAVLGRTAECDVGLKGSGVSRKHARVEERPEGWTLVDLGSRNGIHLDGRRLAEFALADGGSFEVGDVELRFRLQEQGAKVALPPMEPPAGKPRPKPQPEPEPEVELELDEDPFSDEITFEDEELFEQAPARPAAAAPAPTPGRPAPGPGAAPEAPSTRGKAAPSREAQRLAAAGIRGRPGAEGGRVHDGGRPVLQFAKQGAESGPLGGDLGQFPLWARVAAGLAAIAVFVGLFYAAFQLTGSLKERSFSDGDAEFVDDGSDTSAE